MKINKKQIDKTILEVVTKKLNEIKKNKTITLKTSNTPVTFSIDEKDDFNIFYGTTMIFKVTNNEKGIYKVKLFNEDVVGGFLASLMQGLK